MILQVDARKVQVLLDVLSRAPVTVAEQLVCGEIVAMLVQLAEGEARPTQPPTGGVDAPGQ